MKELSTIELYKAATETQLKYVYFLLATSGAAIAYTTEKVSSSSISISWTTLIVIIALISWCCSFYTGCIALQYDISVKNFSFDASQQNEAMVEARNHLSLEQMSKLEKLYSEGIQLNVEATNNHAKASSKYMKLQFIFLIIGVVLFVIWRFSTIVLGVLSP